MPDFPRTARMWMLGAGVAAGISATAVTTGGQTVDCTLIDEARRAVCNIKVLEALGKIKTSESSNGPFPHDAVINQQERQEWLRARYDGRIGMPTWPIPAPLLPDDAATAALLLGEWEGLQVALDGKTTTAVRYAVKTVTGITVGGTLDDKTVTGTLAGGGPATGRGEGPRLRLGPPAHGPRGATGPGTARPISGPGGEPIRASLALEEARAVAGNQGVAPVRAGVARRRHGSAAGRVALRHNSGRISRADRAPRAAGARSRGSGTRDAGAGTRAGRSRRATPCARVPRRPP